MKWRRIGRGEGRGGRRGGRRGGKGQKVKGKGVEKKEKVNILSIKD